MAGEKILVVEDSPATLEVVKRRLTKEGYNVHPVHNGFEALRDLESIKPDLIISDINMPKLDGLKLCQAIQNRSETKSIPFIFLSSQVDEKSLAKAADIGAKHFFAKPFDLDLIAAKVKEIFAPKP
jgi:two-component system chemotaxis response regulator CheY